MNLFENILNKAKSRANYLSSGQLGSDIFDATYKGGDATQTLPYKAVNKLASGISKVTGQGMEDPTQSLLFKGVQGSANLYTGTKELFQRTAQEEKQDFDMQMSQKRHQFISDMLAQGKNKEDIFSALDSLQSKGAFEYKPGVAQSIVAGIGDRMQKIETTTERLSKIENPLERTVAGVLPYMGHTVATPLQPIASGLEPFVSPVVQKVIEKTGQTQNVQELAKGWSEFEQKNPILAENIAGLLNVLQLAPVPFVKPVADLAKQGAKATGKVIVQLADVVSPKVVQGVKTIVTKTPQAIGKGTATLAEGGLSQVSGLERSSIQNIVKAPELFKKARTGEITRETELANASSAIERRLSDLSEMGKGYEAIRNAEVTIPKSEVSGLVSKTLDELGFEKSPTGQHNLIDLPNQDRTAIQSALKYVDEYTGDLSAKNALSLRQKLDSLIDWKSDATPAGERVVKAIRSKLDEYIGERIPGLKELDLKYGPEKEFLRGVRKGLYNKDGSLKDNALSTIGNITGKGKEAMLARLEEITPGIGKRIEALKAFEDVQRSSGIKVGAYTRSAGSVALGVVNPFVALATWIATHPVVVSRVLESAGLATQKIKAIIAKGKKITQSEAKIVQDAVAKVPQTEVEKIITNLAYDPKKNSLTSRTIVGPKVLSTKGKIEIKKVPESPVARENGYTMSVKKPIVKRSADIGGGVKMPKGKKIYDEIIKNNKDITSVSFDDFYTFSKWSKMKGMTKDKAWKTWGNAVIKKIEKGESPSIEILKKNPLIGVMIKDYLKTGINPFDGL